MKYVQAIREFLSALFGSKLVKQLREDLDHARSETAYFRGQFERMQLIATPRIAPQPPRQPRPEGATQVGARKSWPQILAVNTEEQNKIAAKEAAAKKEN